MRPLVSVVMPVFNAASTLEAAARSLLDGTLDDFELICVDDGSTDRSADLLGALASADRRVVVLSAGHHGIVGALNAGLQVARASYVARMDADDWSAPQRLAAQVGFLEANPDIDLVGCRVRIVTPDGSPPDSGMRRYERWVNGLLQPDAIARERFVESPVVHPSVMARRELFEGGYRAGQFPEDYELWLRRLASGRRFAKLDQVLFHWTDRPERLTRCDPRCSADAFRELKLRYLMSGPLEDGQRDVVVWGTGPNGKRWLQSLAARQVRVPLAVELDPRKLGKRIHGALVVHPDQLGAHRRGELMLLAVGAPGGREWIRTQLPEPEFVEGRDYWAVC